MNVRGIRIGSTYRAKRAGILDDARFGKHAENSSYGRGKHGGR